MKSDAPSTRIAGADASGFTLIEGLRHWHENWDAVDNVVLARIPWAGDVSALALAVGIGGGERCVLAYEAEAVWTIWMDAALASLSGMMPPDLWVPLLSAPNKGIVIYHRDNLPRIASH